MNLSTRYGIPNLRNLVSPYAKCHLRLVIDEDNSAVFRSYRVCGIDSLFLFYNPTSYPSELTFDRAGNSRRALLCELCH